MNRDLDMELSGCKCPPLKHHFLSQKKIQTATSERGQTELLFDKVNRVLGTGIIMKVITNGGVGRLNGVSK